MFLMGVGMAPAVEASLASVIERARRADGAAAIVPGSGGLTRRAGSRVARHGLTVIDAIEVTLVLSEAMARMQVRQRQI